MGEAPVLSCLVRVPFLSWCSFVAFSFKEFKNVGFLERFHAFILLKYRHRLLFPVLYLAYKLSESSHALSLIRDRCAFYALRIYFSYSSYELLLRNRYPRFDRCYSGEVLPVFGLFLLLRDLFCFLHGLFLLFHYLNLTGMAHYSYH